VACAKVKFRTWRRSAMAVISRTAAASWVRGTATSSISTRPSRGGRASGGGQRVARVVPHAPGCPLRDGRVARRRDRLDSCCGLGASAQQLLDMVGLTGLPGEANRPADAFFVAQAGRAAYHETRVPLAPRISTDWLFRSRNRPGRPPQGAGTYLYPTRRTVTIRCRCAEPSFRRRRATCTSTVRPSPIWV